LRGTILWHVGWQWTIYSAATILNMKLRW
jgi:hypothetical protein